MKPMNALAFGGVMAALGVVILLFTATPMATVALAAVAALTVIPPVIEINKRTALAVYAAVALISLLLVPAWEGKAMYIGFFGHYAVVKAALEGRQMPRAAEWACKTGVFLLSLAAGGALAVFVGGVPLPTFHPVLWAALVLGATAVFVLYDIGLSRLIAGYMHRLHPMMRRLFRM